MASADLIDRMHWILDEFEAGRLSSAQVESAIEFQMQGLEGIDLSTIHASRDLTYRLVTARFSDGMEEFGTDEEAAAVVACIRDFLRTLPGANDKPGTL